MKIKNLFLVELKDDDESLHILVCGAVYKESTSESILEMKNESNLSGLSDILAGSLEILINDDYVYIYLLKAILDTM